LNKKILILVFLLTFLNPAKGLLFAKMENSKKDKLPPHLFIDLSNPDEKTFELNYKNNLIIKGKYSLADELTKTTIFFENFDAQELINAFENIPKIEGKIKKGKLELVFAKKASLRGYINLVNFNLKNKNADFSADIDLEIESVIEDNLLKYNLDYEITKGNYLFLKNIEAAGFLNNEKIELSEGIFYYKKIPFKAKAQIMSVKPFKIKLQITDDNLKLKTHMTKLENSLDITKLSLEGKKSKLIAKGTISLDDLSLNIEGNGNFDLIDAFDTLNPFNLTPKTLNSANTSGPLYLKFIIKAKDKNWEIKSLGRSRSLRLYNIEINNANFRLFYSDKNLTLSPLTARIGEGKIDFRTKIDFKNKALRLNFTANDIDIDKALSRLGLKKKYSGILSSEIALENNDFSKTRNLEGQGKISIKDGNIWQIDFLKGLGEFLFIPEFEDIMFSEGYSDMKLKENSVIFENMQLSSSQMILEGAGKISLDGDIEFMLFPNFNEQFVDSSEGFKKYLTKFLGKSGLVIEVKGKLNEPDYKMKPIFLSPLKKIKDFFENLVN